MEKTYNLGKVLPFWDILTDEEQKQIIHSAVILSADNDMYINSTLFSTDGPVWVVKGSVREFVMSKQGRELTLYRFYQGDNFNHSTVVFLPSNNAQRGGFIYAGSELVHIPRDIFFPIAMQHPGLWEQFLGSLDDIYAKSLDLLCSAVFDSVGIRLAKHLLNQSQHWNATTVRATHEELANELGSTRVVISRELEHLAKAGAIDIHRGRITIKDREKLQEVAES